jgi:hypothetical protein
LAELRAYLEELKKAGVGTCVLVVGSFVTANLDPNDVDLLLAVPATSSLTESIRPDQYNLVSRKRVAKRFSIDLFVEREGSERYNNYVRFFQRIRTDEHAKMGVLRVML